VSYDPERELERYLKRLSRATRDLPRARRRELVSEIEQHIRQALAEAPVASEAELLTLLDQVGDPAEIVAAAGDREGPVRSTRMEIAAIVLLLIGGFLWGVGWLVGVVLLWSSDLWTLRDKLIGTLVVPGGLATAFFVVFIGFAAGGSARACVHHLDGTTTGSCTGGPPILQIIGIAIGLAVLVLAPIATSVYLGRRLNRHKHASIGPASAITG
jgi:hypothetical protein